MNEVAIVGRKLSKTEKLGWRRHRLIGAGSKFRLLVILLTSLQLVFAHSLTAEQPATKHFLARSYFANARKALSAGDSATALEQLRQAIQADPTFADAYLLLGSTEFQSGEIRDSIQHYKRALELRPQSYSGHFNLALAYLRQREFQDARPHLEQAVKLDARQADAPYGLAIVTLELGEPSTALKYLKRARALDPQRPDVAFNIVRALLEQNQIASARAEAQVSAKRFGSDFDWVAALGQLFLKKAQAKDAAVYLHEASLIHPNDTEIRRQLAMAYLEAHEPGAALDSMKQPATADDHYLRGTAYYAIRLFPEADQESEQALALAPDDPRILVLRTRLLQRAGQQDAALQTAKKAITLAPNWDEPYYLAGVSSYFIRRYDEASRDLARARELNPNLARAFFLEAIALANQGKLEDAEERLRRAIIMQPNNARFHSHLGILLARKNQQSEAEASFREAIQLNPNYALSHYELGKLLVSSQRFREAVDQLEQATRQDPGMGAAYYQLARLYSRLGEAERAERALAEFQKIYQNEASDSQAADQAIEEDTRKETESH